MGKTTAQLINQDSGKTEYYTPDYILDAASATMGEHHSYVDGRRNRFDLDPASSYAANEHVRANRFFSERLNGLQHSWVADSVWLNHPYKREHNREWIRKAVSEHLKGNALQICMITWASTSEQWIHPLFRYAMCFLNKRVKFIDPDRVLTGATKSSVVTYLGPRVDAFIEHFSPLGHIMFPYDMLKTEIKEAAMSPYGSPWRY